MLKRHLRDETACGWEKGIPDTGHSWAKARRAGVLECLGYAAAGSQSLGTVGSLGQGLVC